MRAGATGPAATSAGSASTRPSRTTGTGSSPALQRAGYVGPIITQNVDGLHQASGATDVVELHGSLDRAVCLTCGEVTERDGLHERMTEANPGFMERFAAAPRLSARSGASRSGRTATSSSPTTLVETFHAPRCLVCGHDTVKPDVVFFGESVPKALVEQCFGARRGGRLGARARVVARGDERLPLRAARAPRSACRSRSSPGRPRAGDAEATLRLTRRLGRHARVTLRRAAAFGA